MFHEIADYDVLISKYLDNEITPEEKRELLEWVKQSKENERYFVQFAHAWEESTISLQDPVVARQKVNAFFAFIQKQKKRTLYLQIIGAAAAVLLLFVGVRILQPEFLFGPKMVTVVAENSKKEALLPDGSAVWLNAHSTLKYPARFKRSRNVQLTGEAYFNVRKNAAKPFSVHTKNLTIEVKGTTFLVTDHEKANVSETVLESGIINLTIRSSGKKIAMKPNQQVIYNRTTGEASLQVVNAADYTGWKAESLVFENTPLKDVFIQLGKWYNIDINCANDNVLTTPVSLTVDKESLEEILGLLQHISGFSWKKTSDNKILIQ